MIIGITGTNGAGKGTVVDMLKKKGFIHFSASEFITKEIIKRGLPVNRDSMIVVANDLRARFGPGYIIATLLYEAAQQEKDAIVESIRTTGEIQKLRDARGILIGVDADQKTRYTRIQARKSEKDNVSYEEFVSQEEKEMSSDDPNKHNLRACITAADFIILNNGSKKDLKEKVERLPKKLYSLY